MKIEYAMEINFSDTQYLKSLMDEYGDSKFPFTGKNESGEDIEVSIYKDRIILVTYQENGWCRHNWYWKDGTVEEMFKGRWK